MHPFPPFLLTLGTEDAKHPYPATSTVNHAPANTYQIQAPPAPLALSLSLSVRQIPKTQHLLKQTNELL